MQAFIEHLPCPGKEQLDSGEGVLIGFGVPVVRALPQAFHLLSV